MDVEFYGDYTPEDKSKSFHLDSKPIMSHIKKNRVMKVNFHIF